MSSLYCSSCTQYFRLEAQSPVCPHEPLQRPESLNEYGWKLSDETRGQIDSLYRENDLEGIRVWLTSINPLVRMYADFKLSALKLADEILSRVPRYEVDSQAEEKPWLSNTEYFGGKD